MQVETLHDKPVAVPSLMEKFPLDLGIIIFACCANTAGGGGGVLPYIHVFYLGYIGMCRCEGNGFQAVYSGIGYINQRVWV